MDSSLIRWTDADLKVAADRAYEQGVQDERRRLLLLHGEMLEAWDANARRAYLDAADRRRASYVPPQPVRAGEGWPEVVQPGGGAL